VLGGAVPAFAGSADRVVSGHNPKQVERFPSQGRIAKIR
jgi:hypothetical protein